MFGGVLEPQVFSEKIGEVAGRAFRGLVQIIEDGQSAGVFHGHDTQTMVVTAWSVAHGIAMLAAGGQLGPMCPTEADVESMTRHVIETLMQGVLAPEAR